MNKVNVTLLPIIRRETTADRHQIILDHLETLSRLVPELNEFPAYETLWRQVSTLINQLEDEND